MTNAKYPNIKVQLTGHDGNAFAILGRMQRELRRAKIAPEEIRCFLDEATSGDYAHLLATCMRWVEVA